MDYSRYSDQELRSVIATSGNFAAATEAMKRFCNPKISDEDLQKVQDILDEMESLAEDCDSELDQTFSPESVLDWARCLKEALHVG